jgi:hypothetical protein
MRNTPAGLWYQRRIVFFIAAGNWNSKNRKRSNWKCPMAALRKMVGIRLRALHLMKTSRCKSGRGKPCRSIGRAGAQRPARSTHGVRIHAAEMEAVLLRPARIGIRSRLIARRLLEAWRHGPFAFHRSAGAGEPVKRFPSLIIDALGAHSYAQGFPSQ